MTALAVTTKQTTTKRNTYNKHKLIIRQTGLR